jgi:hypothetical protein
LFVVEGIVEPELNKRQGLQDGCKLGFKWWIGKRGTETSDRAWLRECRSVLLEGEKLKRQMTGASRRKTGVRSEECEREHKDKRE